jgi:hypothetical protein
MLIKENDFYNNIFNLFELSNIEKYKNLVDKKKILGKITPKEAGIIQKFCLDKNSKININEDIKKTI